MPRRRPISDDDERLPPSILTEPDDPAESALKEILREHGNREVQIKVYRVLEGGKQAYCHTLASHKEATEEHVRALGYGDGEYLLKIIIAGEYRTSVPMVLAAKAAPIAQPNGAASGDSALIQFMKETAARQERMIEALITRGATAEREPITQIVSAVAQMQALNKPPELPVETLMKAIEIGRSLAGGGGEDESFMSTVKEVMKAAAPGFAQALMAGRGVPSEAPRQIAQPSPKGEIVSDNDEKQLKVGIAFLKKKCLAGSNPNLYLALIADGYEDNPLFQALIHRVVTADFASFVSIDPEIGGEPFEPFFRAIYDGLRSAFKTPDPMEANTGGEGRNNGNTPRHVGAGKKRNKG